MRKDNRANIDYVQFLLDLVDKNKLEELSIEEGPIIVKIKGKASDKQNNTIITQPINYEQKIIDSEIDAEDDPSVFNVVSPLVGTFYTSSSPEMPPFVNVGDKVNVGDELGLIEAMKVFSPIPSEVSGKVISINVKSGELVKQGQVLLKIKLS